MRKLEAEYISRELSSWLCGLLEATCLVDRSQPAGRVTWVCTIFFLLLVVVVLFVTVIECVAGALRGVVEEFVALKDGG